MTTTGGGGVLLVDNLGLRGVTVTGPGMAVAELATKGITYQRLSACRPDHGGTNPKMFGATLDGLLGSSENNAVVTVVGSSSQYRPQGAVVPLSSGRKLRPSRSRRSDPECRRSRMLAEASITPVPHAGGLRRRHARLLRMASSDHATKLAPRQQIRAHHSKGKADKAVDSRTFSLGIERARTVTLGMNAADLSSIRTETIKFPVAVKSSHRHRPQDRGWRRHPQRGG